MKELLRKFPSRHEQEWIAHCMGVSWSELWHIERPLLDSEKTRIEEGIAQIRSGMPLDYLIGEREFAGVLFKSDQRALAPRLETELLFERFCEQISPKTGQVALDLCTGSGILGLSLKRRFPQLHVCLSDISEEALSLARENGEGIEVEYLLGDFLEPFKGRKAHYLLCNPPYLSKEEYAILPLHFEPKRALVGGDRGDEFYERLARELGGVLAEGALVGLEIGSSQGGAVKDLFKNHYAVRVEKDLAGCDRFVFLNRLK